MLLPLSPGEEIQDNTIVITAPHRSLKSSMVLGENLLCPSLLQDTAEKARSVSAKIENCFSYACVLFYKN